jgi:hypothetical protein
MIKSNKLFDWYIFHVEVYNNNDKFKFSDKLSKEEIDNYIFLYNKLKKYNNIILTDT